jgi:hypothetical protein
MKIRRHDKIIITATLILLIYGVQMACAALTATEGFAIDMSSAGAGTDFTVAFDPSEITGGTTWDDGADASVIWTWDLSGTDPTLTFGSALVTVGGGLTTTLDLIVTGGDITLGTTSIFSGGDVASLNNIDAIDATTETTFEAAIDALANLVTTGTITTGVWNAGAVTSSGAITATSGMDLGTSQALVGTTAMTIGNNAQTVAINSSDWDIDATGIATGMGNITSNGTIEATAHTQGGQAMYDADDVPGGELGGTFASFTIDDSVTVTGWVLGTSSATQLTSPTLITNLLDTTGAADMDYGSLDVLDHTFITDGVGTAEIVLPAGSIDGTEILDDTIDSADYAAASIDNEHLADDAVDSDELAAGSVDDAHIADDTIQEPALNTTNAAGAGTDNYLLSYNHAGTNFTWVVAGAGDMTKAVYDSGDSGGVDVLTTVDSTYASDYVLLTGTAVGTAAPKTDGALIYNATTGQLGATSFAGSGASLTALDGENISNDTIDVDSLDWGAFTDLGEGGAVTWGNLAAGELTDDSINDADINWGTGAGQVSSDDVTEGSTNLFKTTKYEEIDIFNASVFPDATGEAYFDTLENICTNATNTALKMLALELEDPTADCGWYGSFRVPPDFSDTPQIVLRGELNNNDGTLAFGITATPGIASNESVDQAYEAEDTANVDCTGYSDEDEFVVTITLTPASAYAAGDTVYYYCYRDFSADTQTGSVGVTNVHFRYEDR